MGPGGVPTGLFVAAVLIGLAVGFLLGVRPRDYAHAELKAGWAFVLAALIEALVRRGALAGWLDPATWGRGLELLALLLIAYGLLLNLHLRGIWLVALGFFMNTLAILTHGGQMPVTADALRRAGIAKAIPVLEKRGDGLHVLAPPGDPLWWLGDIIPLRHQVISLGDLAILFGVALATVELGFEGKRRRMDTVKRDG